MKRTDLSLVVGILLVISLSITGLLGYLQSELELRKFVPHRYFAYATLILAGVHVSLHWGRLWQYLRRKSRKN